MRIRTSYQGSLAVPEAIIDNSITVPDCSMSIREMVERMIAGLSVPGSIRHHEDSEDDTFDTRINFVHDLTDLDDMIAEGHAAASKLASISVSKARTKDEVSVNDTRTVENLETAK